MLIKQIISTDDGLNDAEQVITIVKNVDGSGSFTTGLGVALVTAGTSIDGVSATKLSTTNTTGFMGIANQNIPINGYGQVVSWGWANNIALSNVGTSVTVTAGNILQPGGLTGTFTSSIGGAGLSAVLYNYVVAASTVTISGVTNVSGIVRAL